MGSLGEWLESDWATVILWWLAGFCRLWGCMALSRVARARVVCACGVLAVRVALLVFCVRGKALGI